MFKHFYERYQVTQNIGNATFLQSTHHETGKSFGACINELGGKTFNHGIYRVYRGDQIAEATEMMVGVFPELRNRIVCFGYDWLGRNFAIDLQRRKKGSPLVIMLEPGAGEAMEVPVSIMDFHNDELVNYANDALAIDFYRQWIKIVDSHKQIQPFQCVGYKIPLFLGGFDTIDNLELIDLDVYLNLCGQLRNKAIELPDGMIISDLQIQ